MSKRAGPARIPVFGSRIPIPGQIPVTNARANLSDIQLPKLSNEVTTKDVGKKVRVADKEGVLRFIGNVHFATGVWCGVELSSAVGKNDGCVRGVRYFACPESCGLMAPHSKVLLIDEIAEDAASGPYSMIFDVNDQLVSSTPLASRLQNAENVYKKDKTLLLDNRNCRKIIRSQTFDKLEPNDILNEKSVDSRTCVNANSQKSHRGRGNDRNKPYSNTQISCDATIVNVPQHDSDEFLNHSGSSNETIINISITNKTRTYKISHTDRSVSDTSQNNETIKNRTYTNDNITFDVRTDNKVKDTKVDIPEVEDKTKNKAPSQLNFRGIGCNDTLTLKRVSDSSDKRRTYSILEEFESPDTSLLTANKFVHSTPIRNDIDVQGSPKKSVRLSPAPVSQAVDEESNKRDSLDFDESLGILTPDQMVDASCFAESRSPSSENIRSLPNDLNVVLKFQKAEGDLVSPNVVDASKDISLGLINEQLLSPFTMLSDTTMNMELPLDTENKSKNFTTIRVDQTPSPEELPLDPTPIIESEPKTESSQSKTTSNFITSVTSITSIDTGYQGDGEMSRPASRGADNSPLTRRPLPRPPPRRPDPMTDSDFYTESDADNHEEHPLRGDRRAQVIDGTLYGVDPQAAADIYVNNRENMDSSGIFTDIESNTRAEELADTVNDSQNTTLDASPSDSSTKTISENSQDNVVLITKSSPNPLQETQKDHENTQKEIIPKRHTPSPSTVTSSPTSIRSPRHTGKEDSTKKYKMPKRNVASKVKAMLEPNNPPTHERKTPVKKTVGRWDAVMNKISKSQGEQIKTNLKEIKSKVFTTASLAPERNELRKATSRPSPPQKTVNNKLRRVRTRATTNTTQTKNATNIESSIHSSLSDLSGASPVKKTGSAKKQREVLRVTQVLTTTKLSPKSNNHNTNEAAKKTPTTTTLSPDVKANNKRNIFSSKEKRKEVTPKECGRTTVKGGRVSPGTRPPQQQRTPIKAAPKTAEALAVLVQHLVFNLEAFRVPSLKREVNKIRLDAEEVRLSYQQLEEQLSEEAAKHTAAIEAERDRFRADITALIEEHRSAIAELKGQHIETEQRLQQEAENIKNTLTKLHDEQLQNLKQEFNKLQKTHAESLDILREENDAIREEIDEKNAVIDKLRNYKYESEKLRKDYEAKETNYKEQLQAANEEIAKLTDENETIINYGVSSGDSSMQEVRSLRAVLELKQSEVSELRKALAEAREKADLLPIVEEKVRILTARCEDLLSQLERKSSYEMLLLQEKKKLDDTLKEEINQKRRLKQHNEELQWKMQQNKEVVSRVLEQAEENVFNRSMLSASFNERHTPARHSLERTHSFKERSLSSSNSGDVTFPSRKSKNSSELDIDEYSPPSSPKVKGVIEKSDSVSYVLEMDESPDVVASRIVRRSFRNSTPPKNTPTKSPVNKRPRMKNNPLSLSASASAIIPIAKTDHMRARSISVRNGNDYDTGSNYVGDIIVWEVQANSTPVFKKNYCESSSNDGYRSGSSSCKLEDNLDLDEEHDVDIKLPSLPSEIGRNSDMQSLPVPRHLAGDAMVSESNSDDESTTSSSSGQL